MPPEETADEVTYVDPMGFEHLLSAPVLEQLQREDRLEAVHESKWRELERKAAAVSPLVPVTERVLGPSKRLCRSGIPMDLRCRVWLECSGAAAKKAANPNIVQTILVQHQDTPSPSLREIEQDIPRTFPEHELLKSDAFRSSMRNVLLAYAYHNPEVGYCQSLNFVTAFLLLVSRNSQDDTFWLLSTLIDDILYTGMYSRNLIGCQVEQRVLRSLLRKKLPKMFAHFEKMQCDLSFISTEWLLCVYAKSMPAMTVLRIWDGLFTESSKLLFRAALAVFKTHEELIMAQRSVADVIQLMRNECKRLYNRSAFMTLAYNGIGSLSMAPLKRRRVKWQGRMEIENEKRQQQRELSKSRQSNGFR